MLLACINNIWVRYSKLNGIGVLVKFNPLTFHIWLIRCLCKTPLDHKLNKRKDGILIVLTFSWTTFIHNIFNLDLQIARYDLKHSLHNKNKTEKGVTEGNELGSHRYKREAPATGLLLRLVMELRCESRRGVVEALTEFLAERFRFFLKLSDSEDGDL